MPWQLKRAIKTYGVHVGSEEDVGTSESFAGSWWPLLQNHMDYWETESFRAAIGS